MLKALLLRLNSQDVKGHLLRLMLLPCCFDLKQNKVLDVNIENLILLFPHVPQHFELILRLTFSNTPDEALVETRQKLVKEKKILVLLERKFRPFGHILDYK